jgi:hypothetical protein
MVGWCMMDINWGILLAYAWEHWWRPQKISVRMAAWHSKWASPKYELSVTAMPAHLILSSCSTLSQDLSHVNFCSTVLGILVLSICFVWPNRNSSSSSVNKFLIQYSLEVSFLILFASCFSFSTFQNFIIHCLNFAFISYCKGTWIQ